MHNLVRINRRIIIQMHFYRLRKVKQGLPYNIAKFSNLGCSYEVVGGITIQ